MFEIVCMLYDDIILDIVLVGINIWKYFVCIWLINKVIVKFVLSLVYNIKIL